MSSTYGWLTESALAIERPVPLRGVSQQSQLRLSSIVRKQRESQQAQVDAQRSLFVEAAKEGRVFTHDAPCSRRWTRPSKKPLDWIGRQLAGKNDGVTLRNAADERDRVVNSKDINDVSIHLERKSKLYDRLVGGLSYSTSAVQLLQLNQKRRISQRDNPLVEPTGPLLSTEALAELLNLPECSDAGRDDENALCVKDRLQFTSLVFDKMEDRFICEQRQAARLVFLQARLNLYRHALAQESFA